MIKLLIDCFGGDHSPEANVEGAVLACGAHPDLTLILTGDEPRIRQELQKYTFDAERIQVVHAPDVIGCDEKPTDAIRLKRESSMMKAIALLRTDDSIAGLVSNGSTGALVAAAVLRIGRLKGVIRPAFCPVLPTMNGGKVGISDSGANITCTAEELLQFGLMASLYLEKIYDVPNPRVALLNVGTEAEKGDDLRLASYALLQKASGIRFVGNMEARDLLKGGCDVVVCDGFSGNVLVKSTEGACLEMLLRLKHDLTCSLWNKIGALFLLNTMRREKEFMN